jgi:hypothetical protein
MLLDQNWLDPISRESALHKLNKLKKMIGALDISHNITLLDNYYKDLDFSANDTLRDLNRKIAIFNDHKKLLYILHPSNFTRAASYLSTTKDSIHIYAENLICKFKERLNTGRSIYLCFRVASKNSLQK